MDVDYNNFAETFAQSREDMKWPEILYFFSLLEKYQGIIDVACWNGRLIKQYNDYFWQNPAHYLWIDSSDKLLDVAKSTYNGCTFITWSMEDSASYFFISDIFWDIKKNIFCIAWLHHIVSMDDKIQTLLHWYRYLHPWEKVYMTNWALESSYNIDIYKHARIADSENQFWAHDFSIKIGWNYRWYHSFTLTELEYLASKTWFLIVENTLFHQGKNFITILER